MLPDGGFHLAPQLTSAAELIITGGSTAFQVIHLPKSGRFLYGVLVGSGGPGASGFSAASLTQRGGGGGGGSAAMTVICIPLACLPNDIYVRTGSGGSGTILAITPDTSGSDTWVAFASGGGPAAAAAAPSATAGGVGGTAGTISVATAGSPQYSTYWPLTTPEWVVGRVGTAGGASAVGGTPTAGLYLLNSGAGGAGVAANNTAANGGAGLPVSANSPRLWPAAVAGGVGQAAANASNGEDGISFSVHAMPIMMRTGGAGGGSSGTGVGGAGGVGALGCGGGGGGAGVTGGAGGAGGFGYFQYWIL